MKSKSILDSKTNQIAYIVYLDNEPYKTANGVTVHFEYEKAENYMHNAIRNVGRLLCENEPWYDMGEDAKQKWFEKAKESLSVKTFIESF